MLCAKKGHNFTSAEAALEPSKKRVGCLEKLKSIPKERITPFQ